jgi:hypothetical protein
MKTARQIVHDQIIFELGNNISLDNNLFNETFWIDFTNAIISFENNPKIVYQMVLKLKMDPKIIEKLISIIPNTFAILISELAEQYSKGHNSELTTKLLNSKETIFKKEVDFFSTLRKAIKIIELEEMRSELPFMFEKLVNKYLEDKK